MRTKLKSLHYIALAIFLPIVALCLVYFSLTTPTQAATSSNLNFQARLLTSSGRVVDDGYYNIEFKLYTASSGGSAVWTETWYDSNGVTAGNDNRLRVVNGYVTVNLGAQTAFGAIDWDQEHWLTMNIGGTTQTATPTWDGEMTPRLKLTAVPYAFKAGQLAKRTGANTSTLDFATQTGARTLLLPDESGTLCIQNSANCGFAANSGSANYIQNQNASPQTADFNVSGAGTVGGNFRTNGDSLFRTATNSTTAFQIQNAGGQNLLIADTTNQRVAIGPAAIPANGILTIGTNTTTASGGLYFGTDTNLYRSATGSLKTDGALSVVGHSAFGGVAQIDGGNSSSNYNVLTIEDTITTLASQSLVNGVANTLNLNTSANVTAEVYGNNTELNLNIGSNTFTNVYGSSSVANVIQSGNGTGIFGAVNTADYQGTGTVSNMFGNIINSHNQQGTVGLGIGSYALYYNTNGTSTTGVGLYGVAENDGSGSIGTAIGGRFRAVNSGSGTITNGYGIEVRNALNSGGGIFTNNYGIYIQDQSGVGSTNSFNFYSAGTTAKNYIAGKLQIGSVQTSSRLNIGVDTDTTAAGGILFGTDTNLYRSAANSLRTDDSFTIAGNLSTLKGTDYSTTGATNNVNLGVAALIRLTGASAQTLTGIAGGADGRRLTLINAGSTTATIANNSGSSTAANRITTGTGADITIPVGSSIELIYDSAASLWRTTGSVAFSTGSYIQNGTSPQTASYSITGTGLINNNSATAFQIQDGSGGAAFTFDTANATAAKLIIGGANKMASSIKLQQYATDIFELGTDDAGLGGNDSFFIYNNPSAKYVFGIRSDGGSIFRNGTDSTTALQIQDAGGDTIFGVDTSNDRINISGTGDITGRISTSATSFILQAVGAGSTLGLQAAGMFFQNSDASYATEFGIGTGGQATFTNSTNSTTAFRIQNAAGQNLFTANTTNQRVAIGPAAVPANGVLTIGTNTTTASGGLYFGTDTNLYRSAANTLQTDDNVYINGGSLTITKSYLLSGSADVMGTHNNLGIQTSGSPSGDVTINSNYAQFIGFAGENLTGNIIGVGSNIDFVTSGSASSITGVDSSFENIGDGSVTQIIGVNSSVVNSGGGTIQNADGLVVSVANSYGTINTAHGLLVQSATNSDVFLNNYGIYIQDQSGVGSTNSYNLYSAGATAKNYIEGKLQLGSTQTSSRLNLGTNADTTAAGGILFGTDTNLYRSGVNVLQTDDSFVLAGTGSNLTVQGTGTSDFAGAIDVASAVAIGNNATVQNTGGTRSNLNINQTYSSLSGISDVAGAVTTLDVATNTDNFTDITINSGYLGLSGSANYSGTIKGSSSYIDYSGTSQADVLQSITGSVYNSSTGTIDAGVGVQGGVVASDGLINSATSLEGVIFGVGGSMVDAIALSATIANFGAGTITNGYGLRVNTAQNVAGTFLNNYGIYIQDQSGVGSTNSYNLYSAGATAKNYIEGKLQLGSVQTSSRLNIGVDTDTTAAGGILFGTDTNLYRSAANVLNLGNDDSLGFRAAGISHVAEGLFLENGLRASFSVTNDAGTDAGIRIAVTGDSASRFHVQSNGSARWGSGSASADVELRRDTSAGQLILQAVGAYRTQYVVQGSASQSTSDLMQFKDSAGTILTAFGSDGKLLFGPSGSQDTNLYRSGTNTLVTDDSFSLLGTSSNLTVQGTGTSTFSGNIQVNGNTTLGNAAADTISIVGATNINLNTNAATNINTGTSTGAINIGGGSNTGITLQAAANVAINIGNNLNGVGGQVNIGVTSGNNSGVFLGSGSGATPIAIGAYDGTITGKAIEIGTGMTNDNITIGGVSMTGAITIGQATTGNQVYIGNGTIATGNVGSIQIGTNAAGTGRTEITIGSTNASSYTAINGGGGSTAISLQTAASGTTLISTNGTNNTTVQIGNANSAVNQTINLGNNTNASSNTTITLGSTQGTGTTTLQGGASITILASGASNSGTVVRTSSNSTAAFQIQNSSSSAIFVADTTNSRIYIGNPTADATGTLLVLDTKNTAGDPTGVNGGMYYNSSSNTFRCYGGSTAAWQDCGPYVRRVSSNATNTSSSAFATATGLSFSMAASTDYTLQCKIVYRSSSGASGIVFGVNGPAGPTSVTGMFDTYTAASTHDGGFFRAYDAGTATAGVDTANSDVPATLSATIRNGTTAGTLDVRFKPQTNGVTATVMAGSSCEFRAIQ